MSCQFCGSDWRISAKGNLFIYCEKDMYRDDIYYCDGVRYPADHISITANQNHFTFFYKNKIYALYHDKTKFIILEIRKKELAIKIHEDLSNDFIPFDFKNIEDENINSYITNYQNILVRVVNLLCFK